VDENGKEKPKTRVNRNQLSLMRRMSRMNLV